MKLSASISTMPACAYLPLLRQGERIETLKNWQLVDYEKPHVISPCFGKGSGLKHE